MAFNLNRALSRSCASTQTALGQGICLPLLQAADPTAAAANPLMQCAARPGSATASRRPMSRQPGVRLPPWRVLGLGLNPAWQAHPERTEQLYRDGRWRTRCLSSGTAPITLLQTIGCEASCG